MTYEEALEETVSRAEAAREIRLHNLDFDDFAAECGYRDAYAGAEVLGWLGY